MDDRNQFADGAILALTAQTGVGRLQINRPEKRNALTDAMWRALPDALAWLTDSRRMRAIVIEGAGGRDFSAGADIGEFESLRKDAGTALEYERANSAAFAAIRTCPVPVIAAIRGICFGGGFGIAAAADLRLADRTARFAIPAARLGLAYPPDAAQDLVRALGDQQARKALFSATELSAAEALACGCLLSVCDADALETEVTALAEKIAGVAPLSVKASKAAVSAGAARQPDEHAERLARATFDSEDYAEGRRAFMEKRAPVFTGR